MITCDFENGNKALLRHVTVNAVIVQDDKILLGKRVEHLSEGGKWGLAGGYLDRDENARDGLTREVREETGYELLDAQLLHINTEPNRPHEDKQNCDLVFIGAVGEIVTKPDDEMTELRWFPLDELPPVEMIAFDHLFTIELFIRYRKGALTIPVLT